MHKEEIHRVYKTVYKFTNYGVYKFSKFQMNERSVDIEAQVSAAYYENQ